MLRYLIIIMVMSGVVGCKHYFGPFAIPRAYEVMPVVSVNQDDTTAELKALQTAPSQPYQISSMDRFNFSVYEHPDLEMKDVVVTPDGFISLPLVGPIKVGGLTLLEATEQLTSSLSQYIRNPNVALIPIEVSGYNFTIAGRVNEPGRYPITIGQTRIFDAIAMSRGFSQGLFQGTTVELADLDNSYVSRNGQVLPVNFSKAMVGGDSLHNIPLMNGDYIYIPSAMNSTVAVLGQVMTQTYVGYRDGMTLLQALPFAKGLLDTHSSYIKIIRGGLKDPVVYSVDVDRMLEGEIQDFQLQANDIVYVPRGPLSDWNLIVSKVLPTLQALNIIAGPFGSTTVGYIND